MAWATYHILEVTISTPFSINTTITDEFLVNKPPYGGDCDVNPVDGKARAGILCQTLLHINNSNQLLTMISDQ